MFKMSEFIEKRCIPLQTTSREIWKEKWLTPAHKTGLNPEVNECSKCCILAAKSRNSYCCQILVLFAILTVIAQALFSVLIYQKYCSLETQFYAQNEETRQLNVKILSRLGFYDEPKMHRDNKEAVMRNGSVLRSSDRTNNLGTPHSYSSRRLLRRHKRGRRCHCEAAIQTTHGKKVEALNHGAVSAISSALRPGLHLKGLSADGQRSQIQQGSGILFRWRRPDRSTGGGISHTERHIEIQLTGLYLIYSQVTIGGRQYLNGSSTLDPSCGHETILIRGEDINVLLSSLLTQANRGALYGFSSPGYPIYPLDTLSHHGVFMLESGDKLAVRTPSASHGDRFAVDSSHNYFGAAMISN